MLDSARFRTPGGTPGSGRRRRRGSWPTPLRRRSRTSSRSATTGAGRRPTGTAFPVATSWPYWAFDELDREEALYAAGDAKPKDILGCLRNALAHGSVTYLAKNWRHSDDSTRMLAFASFPNGNRRRELRLLRVPVDGFQRFLELWTKWLVESGVEDDITYRGPGWFAEANISSS